MDTITFPRFIDFEASGFGDQSYPIEVAWNGSGGTIEAYLINPDYIEEWTHWDDHAQTDAHGIGRDILSQLGDPPGVVVKRMNEALAGQVLYSDAPQFDGFWLSRLYEAVDARPTFKLGSVTELFDLHIHEDFKTQGDSLFHKQERFDRIIDTYGLQAWENIAMRPHRAGHDVLHMMETYSLLLASGGKIPQP